MEGLALLGTMSNAPSFKVVVSKSVILPSLIKTKSWVHFRRTSCLACFFPISLFPCLFTLIIPLNSTSRNFLHFTARSGPSQTCLHIRITWWTFNGATPSHPTPRFQSNYSQVGQILKRGWISESPEGLVVMYIAWTHYQNFWFSSSEAGLRIFILMSPW